MIRYSIRPRDRILVKGYGFLSFAKNMGKSNGKNISKNLSGKYSQKLLDHDKQSATDAFETASKKAIEKTAEAIGDLIGNKIANRITKVSKNSQQSNSERVANEHDKKIPNERYISSEKRQEFIDELRFKQYNNEILKNYKNFKELTAK